MCICFGVNDDELQFEGFIWAKFLVPRYKRFVLMPNSAENEILNAHKCKNTCIKKFSFIHAQISPEYYFMLKNVKMPGIVGILTYMSR